MVRIRCEQCGGSQVWEGEKCIFCIDGWQEAWWLDKGMCIDRDGFIHGPKPVRRKKEEKERVI
jgi:hypothetical protein